MPKGRAPWYTNLRPTSGASGHTRSPREIPTVGVAMREESMPPPTRTISASPVDKLSHSTLKP